MKQIISFEKEIPFKTMIGDITSISLEHTLDFQDDSSIVGDFIVSGSYKLTEASRLDEDFSYKIPVDILLTENLEEENRHVDIENFTYEIVDEEALLVKIDLLVEGLEKIDVEEEAIEVLETCKEEKEERQEEKVEVKEEEEKVEGEEKEEETETEEEAAPVLEKEVEASLLEEVDSVRDQVLKTNQETKPLEEQTILAAQENIDKVSENTQNKIVNNETVTKDLVTPPAQKEVMNSIFSAFKDTDETFSTYSIYILREEDTLDEVLTRYGVTKEEALQYNNLETLKVGSKLILPTVISNE